MIWLNQSRNRVASFFPLVLFAPNDGGANGGGGTGTSATATGQAPPAVDTATESATANSGAGVASATPNGNDPNSNDGKQEPAAGVITLTEAQLTEKINASIGRAKGQWERQQREAQAAAQTDAAKQAGDVAALENTYKQQITDKDTRISELEGELKQRDRSLLVSKVAGKHKLPPELAEVLQGDTEPELETHAVKLAKVAGAPVAPPTEAGGGNGGSANGNQAAANPQTQTAQKNWSFNPPGGVSW